MNQKLKPMRRFLAVAAVWHITVALTIFLVGRTQLAPQTFDTNGIGVSFAIDSFDYREEARDMAYLIRQGRIGEWAKFKASFHVKLYSISFAVAGALVGNNILAAEPLNLLYYLLILGLTYSIAWEIFDDRVALLAGGLVAAWPSLVLHTTQLLRDALFIPSLLLVVLALILIVNRNLSFQNGLLVAIAGTVGALMVWLCRGDSWEIVLAIMLLGAAIGALAQLRQRRFSAGKMVAIGLMLLSTACIPSFVPAYRQSNTLLASATKESDLTNGKTPVPENAGEQFPRWDVGRRIGLLRRNFIRRYPLAGSNIDTNVELHTLAEVIRYSPRAALIGFFAPFPQMWITEGAQVGFTGRLVAGAEMLVMYLVIGLAAFAIVKERRHLPVWLLLGVVAAGCIALGFVVLNLSTLYRMRYAYFILIIILGMKGLFSLMPAKPSPELQSRIALRDTKLSAEGA